MKEEPATKSDVWWAALILLAVIIISSVLILASLKDAKRKLEEIHQMIQKR